jgi:hypothetical protein
LDAAAFKDHLAQLGSADEVLREIHALVLLREKADLFAELADNFLDRAS